MAAGKQRDAKQKRRAEEEGSVKKTPVFKKPKFKTPLGDNRAKKKKKRRSNKQENGTTNDDKSPETLPAAPLSSTEQLSFFLSRFQSANALKLSPLELEAIPETCILELSQTLDQNVETLSKHMKDAFGTSWKEVLYENNVLDGKVDPGSPAVLVISTSALRSLELFRGLRPLTGECRAAKLFAKHMKVEEQVSMLKTRVNIACGTPSRIKKLIDMDVLGLSRLAVIVMDMHTDAKGYSLLTLPQVSDEFWDLYKTHFHHRITQGSLRICLYGPVSRDSSRKTKGKAA